MYHKYQKDTINMKDFLIRTNFKAKESISQERVSTLIQGNSQKDNLQVII